MLGVAGDLGSGLLYFRGPRAGLGGAARPDHSRRLRQSFHCRRRPAQHHRRRRRAQSAHREEVLMPSLPLHRGLLFALFASTVFGITMRDTPRKCSATAPTASSSSSARSSSSVGSCSSSPARLSRILSPRPGKKKMPPSFRNGGTGFGGSCRKIVEALRAASGIQETRPRRDSCGGLGRQIPHHGLQSDSD